MGSSSSKPVRKLSKEATTAATSGVASSVAASRPPPPPRPAQRVEARPEQAHGVRETKTRDVVQDGQDPQLLANLQKLGAVSVPRGKVKFQRSNPMLGILSARQRDAAAQLAGEQDAVPGAQASATRNRMSVSMIIAMLDARKQCRSQRELDELARGYDVDTEVLERLAAFVNAPSIDAHAQMLQKQRGIKVDDGERPLQRVDAVWTEPNLSKDTVRQIQG